MFENEAGLQVLPAKNRAQRLHEIDPERYPRGGSDWFEPDMKPWLQAERAGARPRMIYHSHVEVGAYFSEGDISSALTSGEDGTPVERHPGLMHMVISVRGGHADGAKMFGFDSGRGAFVEVASFDADGAAIQSCEIADGV